MNDFKIILDLPSDAPALGFDQTADALKDIIEDSKPQFVVGIFGTWGSGKTTLMRAIERELTPAKSIALQFSAWRYEREPNLIIPLLDVVREGLLKWADENHAVRQKAIATASVVGKAIYSLLAGVSFKVGVPTALELSYEANKALTQGRDFAAKEKEARVPRSVYHAAFRALEDSFKEFLEDREGPDRIVIFVDDLDRCLPQGALDVLEAMKLFFDLKGFIFVVGLDQSVVERSIDLKYRDEAGTNSGSGSGVRQIRGADYIKKIFQVPFSLAPVAITQLDEFLNAIYHESQLPDPQRNEFRTLVAPHLRYIIVDSGVNPREIKRYLNAYTLSIKIKPYLDRRVMLALQTIAFRRDWEAVQRGLLSYRAIFADAVKRYVIDHEATAVTDLDPTLATIPESFFSYVSAANPGAALLTVHNLDEHIYSGEATRSSLSTVFLDAIRDVAQLTKQLRALEATALSDPSALPTYSSHVSSALSTAQQAGGSRLAGIAKEWLDHVTLVGSPLWSLSNDGAKDSANEVKKKQFLSEEETLRRRALQQLMEMYQFGSTVSASA